MTDEAEPQKDGAAVGFGCSGNLVGFGLIFVLASHSFRIQREAFSCFVFFRSLCVAQRLRPDNSLHINVISFGLSGQHIANPVHAAGQWFLLNIIQVIKMRRVYHDFPPQCFKNFSRVFLKFLR